MGLIIGLTGTIGSGKGTFAKFVSQGGTLLSTGDLVRAFINENLDFRGPNTRERQQYWGNAAREVYGIGVWTKRMIPQIGADGIYAIDCCRYPDQVEDFQAEFGGRFHLIGVDAEPWRRFGFLKARGREGDPKTWKEFCEANRRDKRGYIYGEGQNTEACLRMAEMTVYNNGTLDDLKMEAARVLRELEHS
jgi:dephospho-CoA kinase